MTGHTSGSGVRMQLLNQVDLLDTVLLTDGRVDGASALGGAASSCRPLWGQHSERD